MRKNQLFTIGLLIAAVFIAAGLLWQGDVQAANEPATLISAATVAQDGSDADSGDEVPFVPTDHSEFVELQQEFATGPEVTVACLSCHVMSALEVMKTSHWTWEFEHPDTGQILGKKNVINNFCVATDSNEPRCTSCHVGYGWADNTFDFTNELAVDCLVCHDTTGTYKKYPTAAGHPLYEPLEKPADSGNFI